ncbi:MAG: adenylate/guanylate cyclase domain-containing protein, partial [Bacteroidota bacterium]
LTNNMIRSAMEDKSGNLWFGTDGGGLCKFDGKAFTHFTEKEGLSSNVIISMMEDSKGNLWFGTYDGGVNKFEGKTFTHFTEKEGLSNKHINCILKDKQGNLWMGSEKAEVNMFNGKTFTHYSLKEGFANNDVLCIAEDSKGNLWFGSNGGGLCKFDGKYFSYFTSEKGLNYKYIYCILEDTQGALWLGTYGEGVYRFDGKKFTQFTTEQGLSNNDVFSITEDKAGNLWFGTGEGKVSKYDGKNFSRFSIKSGLKNNTVRSVFEDRKGKLWFGTYGSGVCRFDGKTFTHYTIDEGLTSNNVLSIAEDKNGNLWFGTSFGLSKLPAYTLNEMETSSISNKEINMIFRNYTYEDGFLGVGVNTGKSICEDNEETIWIAANDRLTAYHPDGETSDTIAPNIQLTGIELFNEKINWISLQHKKDTSIVLGNGVRVGDFIFKGISKWNSLPENLSLAYNNNYLTFKFIGITQKSPRKTQYRYKLDGLDDNWNSISSVTEAHYGNLPAGSFTFKVKAMNSEGYWSKVLEYPFIIRPPWWKTWWAYVLYVVFFSFSIVFYIKRRERLLIQRQKVLEKTVEIRTSEVVAEKQNVEQQKANLEIEKKRSDELLLNILPEKVAEELKQKGSAEAQQFEDVTVMFTDFKNFTQITEKLSPSDLVMMIHEYFKGFDQIIGKYNIEKIKTIGDSYMCAGGLTNNNKTTAGDVIRAAIEIRELINQHLTKGENGFSEPFEIRIGIHTGAVVAGIVGIKKFAYDIWGDTVNIASRMENSGEVGKINISGATYELVKDEFKCRYRGKIEAKNKGEIDMYFVED